MKKIAVILLLIIFVCLPINVGAKDIREVKEEPKSFTRLDDYLPSNLWIAPVAIIAGIAVIVVVYNINKK